MGKTDMGCVLTAPSILEAEEASAFQLRSPRPAWATVTTLVLKERGSERGQRGREKKKKVPGYICS